MWSSLLSTPKVPCVKNQGLRKIKSPRSDGGGWKAELFDNVIIHFLDNSVNPPNNEEFGFRKTKAAPAVGRRTRGAPVTSLDRLEPRESPASDLHTLIHIHTDNLKESLQEKMDGRDIPRDDKTSQNQFTRNIAEQRGEGETKGNEKRHSGVKERQRKTAETKSGI